MLDIVLPWVMCVESAQMPGDATLASPIADSPSFFAPGTPELAGTNSGIQLFVCRFHCKFANLTMVSATNIWKIPRVPPSHQSCCSRDSIGVLPIRRAARIRCCTRLRWGRGNSPAGSNSLSFGRPAWGVRKEFPVSIGSMLLLVICEFVRN